jgi:hypothetical protein
LRLAAAVGRVSRDCFAKRLNHLFSKVKPKRDDLSSAAASIVHRPMNGIISATNVIRPSTYQHA